MRSESRHLRVQEVLVLILVTISVAIAVTLSSQCVGDKCGKKGEAGKME